jgi:hypothetical protein
LLSGCNVDADTSLYSAKPRKQQTAEKKHISKQKKGKEIGKMQESYSMYLQQQQWFSHSATAYSRWRCSLLALDRSFSAFFASANADLADFSTLTLAAVAASKSYPGSVEFGFQR